MLLLDINTIERIDPWIYSVLQILLKHETVVVTSVPWSCEYQEDHRRENLFNARIKIVALLQRISCT